MISRRTEAPAIYDEPACRINHKLRGQLPALSKRRTHLACSLVWRRRRTVRLGAVPLPPVAAIEQWQPYSSSEPGWNRNESKTVQRRSGQEAPATTVLPVTLHQCSLQLTSRSALALYCVGRAAKELLAASPRNSSRIQSVAFSANRECLHRVSSLRTAVAGTEEARAWGGAPPAASR